MVHVSEEPRLDVSVYLLKPAYFAAALSELKEKGAAYELQDMPGGAFISIPAEPTPPRWLPFVVSVLADSQSVEVESQTPSGLMWVPRAAGSQTKVFVLTFGQGHTRLTDEWLEPEFGKMVALATVPQGQVVEVRAEQVFARRHIASERAPRASAVRDFGFEPDRDLVAAVEGVPALAHFPLLGRKVRGGTSLRLGILFSRLGETLDRIAERFDSSDHKKVWPQAFNLVAVRDDALEIALDALLDAAISKPTAGKHIVLAGPSERTGEVLPAAHVIIGRLSKNAATSPYLLFGRWQSYLAEQGLAQSVKSARETRVHFLDSDKQVFGSTSLYRCIGAEVTYSGRPFVLASGTWYESTQNFIDATNKALAALIGPTVALTPWDQASHEGVYNAAACAMSVDLWLFDKVMVHFGGGQSKFEFCDIMHLPTRTLYFVKNPATSSDVSHLTEQVRRTAQNFFMPDHAFRKKLAAVVKANEPWDVSWLGGRPFRQDWTLCLVLMGKKPSDLAFFGKCGLARLLNELEVGGFTVRLQSV